MDKLKMMSMDKVQGNVEKIRALFPNAVTEVLRGGKPTLAVDFDVLKQELADTLIDDRELRYQFTWPDKQKSILLANTPIDKTLRPCKEESVDFDNTQNLYIEGDNLEVLKLLQETYLGKIKMIYIDPPYNTGNDFVYNDDFAQDSDDYLESSGQFDEQGNRLFQNTESNGRFHTDWLNMIYPRLRLAKDLLSDDGVIFISIDDGEVDNLRKVCDEIFGESNFVGCISRATGTTTGQDANKIGSSLDYCFVYSKSDEFILQGLEMDEKDLKRFNESDDKGNFSVLQLRKTGNADTKQDRPNMFYPIVAPDGTMVYPFGPTNYLSRWRVSKESYQKLFADNMIVWKKTSANENIVVDGYEKSAWIPYVKYYLEGRTKQVSNLFQDIEGNKKASIVLKDLLGTKGIFDNPKPVEFLSILMKIAGLHDYETVLDFFSGSATTAHAVMQLNSEDGGNRKFIMVQLPEPCDEKSEAFKAGYKNICEIGKERIRRAGAKILKECVVRSDECEVKDNSNFNQISTLNTKHSKLDIGFRVLKLDSSNMQPVYYKPEEYSQTLLDNLADNIKADRTPLDLLFQVMLDLGKPLSAKIEEKVIAGKHVFIVNDDDLIACFDSNVTEETVKAIAQLKPLYAVFRDSSLANDSTAANFDQIFATYSPNTTRKVL